MSTSQIPEGTLIDSSQVEAGMKVRVSQIDKSTANDIYRHTTTVYEGYVVTSGNTFLNLAVGPGDVGSFVGLGESSLIELLAEADDPLPGYYVVTDQPNEGPSTDFTRFFNGEAWLLAEGGEIDWTQKYTITRRITQEA